MAGCAGRALGQDLINVRPAEVPSTCPFEEIAMARASRRTAEPDHRTEQGPDGPGAAQSAAPAVRDPLGEVRHTRVSALWVGVIVSALVLIALLVFILQNSQTVTVSFLGFDAGIPLAVALLLSSVAGALLVAVPGAARIAQLRRAVRKNR